MEKPGAFVILMGDISSGKTKLCEKFEQRLKGALGEVQVAVCHEPVALWQQLGLLAQFYEDVVKTPADNNRTPYIFQQIAFSSRLAAIAEATRDPTINKRRLLVISDGHIEIDRNMFAAMLREAGKINEFDYSLYETTFKHWKTLVIDCVTIDQHLIFSKLGARSGTVAHHLFACLARDLSLSLAHSRPQRGEGRAPRVPAVPSRQV